MRDEWLTLKQIAQLSGGQLKGEDADVYGVSIDSRQVHLGDLFVALKGPRFDGHDFVDTDIEAKAAGVLVHRHIETSLPRIEVSDTLEGLTQLASNWRASLNLECVAVTGSNGKTTVKQMIRQILSQHASVCSTQGNLNNHIGVPLTLLQLRKTHQYLVAELGANHKGEIRHLTHLAKPNVTVINNAGPAHLEGFGSIQGVVEAKGEIIEGLSEDGIAILNADDANVEQWKVMAGKRKVLTFGLHKEADVRGIQKGKQTLEIRVAGQVIETNLAMPGEHNFCNALAATAACHALNISLETIAAGLASAESVHGRLQMYKGLLGSVVLDDTYNANPASLRAAVDVLCAQDSQSWLVLGDMGELGEYAETMHGEMGAYARDAGVDGLFTVGPLSKHAAKAFGDNAYSFDNHQDLAAALLEKMQAGLCVLVKGSRTMHMEEIVALLREPSVVH